MKKVENGKQEKHPLQIQEDKLQKLVKKHKSYIKDEMHLQELEIEELRHKILLDSIKAAINLNYTHTEELKLVFTTLNMTNETLQQETEELQ